MIPRQSRRIHDPIPADLRFTLGTGQRLKLKGEVTDISISGVALVLEGSSPNTIRTGARVTVSIVRAAPDPVLEVGGLIVRSRRTQKGCTSVAVQFDRPHFEVVNGVTTHQQVQVRLHSYEWTN